MNRKKALCICVSEKKNGRGEGISHYICKILEENLAKKRIAAATIDLREASLTPCDGCGRCAREQRCGTDADFNRISDQVLEADYLFFVSPHHAPVPARLCMFLEKVERLAFLYRPPATSVTRGFFCSRICPAGRSLTESWQGLSPTQKEGRKNLWSVKQWSTILLQMSWKPWDLRWFPLIPDGIRELRLWRPQRAGERGKSPGKSPGTFPGSFAKAHPKMILFRDMTGGR